MEEFPLTITVPADEYAYLQRRISYLEALLLRMVRRESALQEWFSAMELNAMFLPGLPASVSAISRKANKENWPRYAFREDQGTVIRFHVTSLPARAFDALVARYLDLPPLDFDMDAAFLLPAPPMAERLPENAAPAWVLPLMRILRTEAKGDLGRAWGALPRHVPEGTELPDAEEAARILVRFGLA